MNVLLGAFIIGCFLALLFVNIYFRLKVVKLFRHLTKNNVEFSVGHVFNPKKMEEEIFPRYPDHVPQIKALVRHMRISLLGALALIALITLAGLIIKTTG